MGKEKPFGMVRGGMLFLLVVLCLYVLAFLVDTKPTLNALDFAVGLLYQLLPVLLLVEATFRLYEVKPGFRMRSYFLQPQTGLSRSGGTLRWSCRLLY